MEVEAHRFNPPISAIVREALVKPAFGATTDASVIESEAEKLAKVLDVYESRLSENKYLAGENFSLADLHHLPYIHYLLKTSKADLITSRKYVKAWWDDISSRPSWKKVSENIKF
ncbi:glutathione S-transferase F13 [Amborella trichopoda]|nr:glutathione S-transferase F13 [Amborella trichopoda]|eukprot:XP_020529874.1 glutathione S-transferase F13 [Amborella trichopoda]